MRQFKTKNNIFLFGYKYYTNNFNHLPNLCPLTWLGTMGLILFIATPITNLITFIKSFFTKESFMEAIEYEELGGFKRFFIQAFLIVFYFAMVIFVWDGEGDFNDIPTWIWLYGWLISLALLALAIGIFLLLIAGTEAIKDSENVEVFKEGVSAKFTKMCPRIDWIINDDTNTNE